MITEKEKRRDWIITISLIVMGVMLYFFTSHSTEPRYFIHSPLDDRIPFCEWFVIPYVHWMVMVPAAIIRMLRGCHKSRAHRDDYLRFMAVAMSGWYLCFIFFKLCPTGITFRPTDILGSSIAAMILRIIYSVDRPANVMPSLHCFAAFAVAHGLCRSNVIKEKKHPWMWRVYYIVSMILICASTVLIKQHSILDIGGAIILYAIIAPLAYGIRRNKTRGAKDE